MEVKIFVRENGKSPLRDYVKKLPAADKNKIEHMLDMFEKYGLYELMKVGYIKKLDKNNCLYELRPYKYRIIFTQVKSIFWLLTCFMKKTNKTPKSELEKAINIRKQIIN